ncbi:MAG TPA: hypothetical protein VLH09_09590 [Bryobacteraceae bacterium]|nr:hypothetical protein [Bryobacteraceae bacterium]
MKPTTNHAFVSTPLRPDTSGGRSADEVAKRAQDILQPTINARIKSGSRPSALAPEKVRGENKAVIEIHQRGLELANQSSLIGSYYDFILGNVQETDAEKVSVMETFGDPHIFASGRFLRKYTFAGACRATPPKWDSSEPALIVSQFLSFRVFYDQYLRASEQVKHRRFTRVVVDGDVYEGWVTTMNLGRAAENEQMVPFTFTLYGIKRSHRDEQKAMTLLDNFRVTTSGKRKFDFTRATAALKEALGDLELTLHERQQTGQAVKSLSVTAETDDALLSGTICYLRAVGSSQILRVSMPAGLDKALSLEYGPGGADPAPVHGALARTTGEKEDGRPLVIRVLSMVPFTEANPEAGADAKSLSLTVPITIAAPTGSSVTLTATISAKTGSQVVIEYVNVLYSHAPQNGAQKPIKLDASGAAPIEFPDVAAEEGPGGPGALDVDGIPFVMTIGVRVSKGAKLPEWFNSSAPAIFLDYQHSWTLERGKSGTKAPLAITSGSSAIVTTQTVADETTATFTITGRLTFETLDFTKRDPKASHLRAAVRVAWEGQWSSMPVYTMVMQFTVVSSAATLYADGALVVVRDKVPSYPTGLRRWAARYEARILFDKIPNPDVIKYFRENIVFSLDFMTTENQAVICSCKLSPQAPLSAIKVRGGPMGYRGGPATLIFGMGTSPTLQFPEKYATDVMAPLTGTSSVTTMLRTWIYLGIEGVDPNSGYSRGALSELQAVYERQQEWARDKLLLRNLAFQVPGEDFPANLTVWQAPGL